MVDLLSTRAEVSAGVFVYSSKLKAPIATAIILRKHYRYSRDSQRIRFPKQSDRMKGGPLDVPHLEQHPFLGEDRESERKLGSGYNESLSGHPDVEHPGVKRHRVQKTT